jgi:Arc/MetJ-type ribon-helix-helix transcriptional regulator
MNLSLNPDVQQRINEWVKSGKFATPEAVVAAAMVSLDQQHQMGDFETGELDSLLAEGEQSIAENGTLDGEEAFRQRAHRRLQRRQPVQ